MPQKVLSREEKILRLKREFKEMDVNNDKRIQY